MPDLSGVKSQRYERYFLGKENGIETRISKIDETYKYEIKKEISGLERTRELPFDWMGKEMTGLPIAKDSKLVDLTEEQFRPYLN